MRPTLEVCVPLFALPLSFVGRLIISGVLVILALCQLSDKFLGLLFIPRKPWPREKLTQKVTW